MGFQRLKYLFFQAEILTKNKISYPKSTKIYTFEQQKIYISHIPSHDVIPGDLMQ